MRIGMLLLRTAGFSMKESCVLLGLNEDNGNYYWCRIQESSGLRAPWQLAEMVRSRPQSEWPL